MAAPTIGRLAREVGVNLGTIRHDRSGWLPAPQRRGLEVLIDVSGHGNPESRPSIAALSEEPRR
jgi:hypothetical protein